MNKRDIFMAYGTDASALARMVLEAADVAGAIEAPHTRVLIKPNLVVPRPAGEGATTHPGIAQGVIEYLLDYGFTNLCVAEGSWLGARTADAFSACGYAQLARRYGVELLDTQKDGYTRVDCAGMPIDVCDCALKAGFIINLPVLKGHCQTVITCGLKNAKGLIPNHEKRRFHTLGLHKPIAHLNAALPRGFVLVDGICGDLDFEEGGNPVPMGRVFGAWDTVLADAFACGLLGYAPQDVPYIAMAAGLGLGCGDASRAQIREVNSGAPQEHPPVTRKVAALARHADDRDACSACYGSLLHALGRMQEDGMLKSVGKVCIGQGYRGQSGEVGVGKCTSAFSHTLAGCPPTAAQILQFLKEQYT